MLERDAKKRVGLKMVMKHRWFASLSFKQAEEADIDTTMLRVFNAKRKFRKGVLGLVRANRLYDRVLEAREEAKEPPVYFDL